MSEFDRKFDLKFAQEVISTCSNEVLRNTFGTRVSKRMYQVVLENRWAFLLPDMDQVISSIHRIHDEFCDLYDDDLSMKRYDNGNMTRSTNVQVRDANGALKSAKYKVDIQSCLCHIMQVVALSHPLLDDFDRIWIMTAFHLAIVQNAPPNGIVMVGGRQLHRSKPSLELLTEMMTLKDRRFIREEKADMVYRQLAYHLGYILYQCGVKIIPELDAPYPYPFPLDQAIITDRVLNPMVRLIDVQLNAACSVTCSDTRSDIDEIYKISLLRAEVMRYLFSVSNDPRRFADWKNLCCALVSMMEYNARPSTKSIILIGCEKATFFEFMPVWLRRVIDVVLCEDSRSSIAYAMEEAENARMCREEIREKSKARANNLVKEYKRKHGDNVIAAEKIRKAGAKIPHEPTIGEIVTCVGIPGMLRTGSLTSVALRNNLPVFVALDRVGAFQCGNVGTFQCGNVGTFQCGNVGTDALPESLCKKIYANLATPPMIMRQLTLLEIAEKEKEIDDRVGWCTRDEARISEIRHKINDNLRKIPKIRPMLEGLAEIIKSRKYIGSV